jgi:hypothetical protein
VLYVPIHVGPVPRNGTDVTRHVFTGDLTSGTNYAPSQERPLENEVNDRHNLRNVISPPLDSALAV